MTTVGEFLQEKTGNMATWLRGEGVFDLQLPEMMPVQLVAFAQTLHDKYERTIDKRDFGELLADEDELPLNVLRTVQFVRERPPLHDKFWRYLKLFSNAVRVEP